jgi:hypothetical protein
MCNIIFSQLRSSPGEGFQGLQLPIAGTTHRLTVARRRYLLVNYFF